MDASRFLKAIVSRAGGSTEPASTDSRPDSPTVALGSSEGRALVRMEGLKAAVHAHRLRCAERLDGLHAETIRTTMATVAVPAPALEECMREVAALRAKGFTFDLPELLRSRGLLTAAQAESVRRDARAIFALCPVCLAATGDRAESDDVPVTCTECGERYTPRESAEFLDSLAGREAPAETPSGTQLGEYRIVRELGRGGMGVVYEADQPALRRRVALKVLPAGITLDRTALERFHREARVMAQLDHANIVKVFGSGESGGNHYYAMELVDGRGLDTTFREAKLDLKKTVGWIALAARALDYAHRHGLVHRDVKPANLLLAKDGRLLLMDFGLARSTQSESVTRTGTIVGTPAYMSPEQAKGHRVDGRSDVYSLGATLYHLVSGRTPFDTLAPELVVACVLNDEPARPSSWNAAVDPSLERIILHAMEKDPERRYPTAAAFAEDLERWLAGEAVEVREPSFGERVSRWVSRHRAVVLPVAAAVLLTFGVMGGVLWGLRIREEALRKEADEAARLLVADAIKQQVAAKEEADRRAYDLKTVRESVEREAAEKIAEFEQKKAEETKRIRAELENEIQTARVDRVRAAAERIRKELADRRRLADDALLGLDLTSMRLKPSEAIDTLLRTRAQYQALGAVATAVVDADAKAMLDADPEWKAYLDIREPSARIEDGLLRLRLMDAWAEWVITHEPKGAAAAIDAVGKLHPGRPEIELTKALLALRSGDVKAAEAGLLAVRDRLPDDVRLHLALAEVKLAARDVEAAGAHIDRAAKAVPAPPDYHYVKGLYYLAQNSLDEALAEFDRGLRLPSGRFLLDLVVGRASTLLAKGKAKEAAEALDPWVRALRGQDLAEYRGFAGNSPGRRWSTYEAFMAHARACVQAGRAADARASATAALREKPDDPAASALLKE